MVERVLILIGRSWNQDETKSTPLNTNARRGGGRRRHLFEQVYEQHDEKRSPQTLGGCAEIGTANLPTRTLLEYAR